MKEMAPETLRAKIKVCMFDQYGTVVDMQKGLTEVVTPIWKVRGGTGDRTRS
jgi:2-haloacid dehalogenase